MTPEARQQILATIAHLRSLLDESDEQSPVVADLWLRYLRTLPDARWVKSVECMMRRVMREVGQLRASQVTPTAWSNYRDGDAKRDLSPTTRNLQLRRLKALFNWATNEGLIGGNPLQRAKPEKSRPKRETEINEEDEARIVDNAPLRLGVLFRVAMGSAMRHDEIRLLRWDQVDLETNTVKLGWDENKSRRFAIVRLTQDAADALRLLRTKADSTFVFASPRTDGPLSYQWFWEAFRAVIDKLGVKAAPGDGRVHQHDARHSVASRLNRKGARLTAIQGVLRHAHLSTTALYIHTRQDEIDEAHRLLEREPRKGPRRAEGHEKMGSESKQSMGG